MNLYFTPEDFMTHHCPPLGDNPRTYSRLAEFVNWMIDKKLKDAPVVYGRTDSLGGAWWPSHDEDDNCTHKALLVEIVPISDGEKK